MSDGEKVLRELTARHPDRLLEELGELARRIRSGEALRRPRVTLHLASARDLSGFVLDVGHEGNQATVLLHTPPEWNVAHVPVRHIEAVTVHDVLGLSRPPADSLPAPSHVELKRRVAGAESQLAVQVGAPILFLLPDPLGEDSLEPLGALLPAVSEALDNVARDESGRQNLAAKVKRVQLAVGEQTHVTLVGDALTVMTVPAHARRLAPKVLERAIHAAL
ncbi:MAG: hypothetical protein IPJ65_20070 [Archangiaceae bacterium]|nr:hypothetical protein [Archangiaceae bacterium]